jgi:hypothetical protein
MTDSTVKSRFRDRTVLGTEYTMLHCGCQHWVEYGYRLTTLVVGVTWLLSWVIGENRALRLATRLTQGPLFYSRVVPTPVSR